MLANMKLKLFQLIFLFLICFIQCIYAIWGPEMMMVNKETENMALPSVKDVLTALFPKPNGLSKGQTLHTLTGKKVDPNSTPQAIGIIFKLPPGISVGKYLKIEGFASPGENIFEINLQKGSNAPTDGDRDFHLSVRFDKETIVLNTLKDNKWQEEQVHEIFPLDTGDTTRKFDITITLEEDHYEIFINDIDYIFQYRIPFEEQHLDFLVISPSFWVNSLQLGSNF